MDDEILKKAMKLTGESKKGACHSEGVQGVHQAEPAGKSLLDATEWALVGRWKMDFPGGSRPKEAAQIKKWFDHIPYLTNDQKLCRKVF